MKVRNSYMGRIKQPKGNKGSLKWIQYLVNSRPNLLNNPIYNFLGYNNSRPIEWLSPKADDDYSEYRDQAFLDFLGIKLAKTSLNDFWPKRGPQWDALGRIEHKTYFLVEAKAHVSEKSSSSQACKGVNYTLDSCLLFYKNGLCPGH